MTRTAVRARLTTGAAALALVTGGVAVATPAAAAPADARITELHYDDAGADTGEAVEVTAPAAADLTGLQVVLYNGSSGAPYATLPVPASETGVAVVPGPAAGIQNGSPDGLALVTAEGAVLEFLSYEGVFTAVGGPAGGLTSTDIGVQENGSPEGQSLQLVDGGWAGPVAATFGSANGGGTPDPEPPTGPACDATAVPIGSVQGPGTTSPLTGSTVTVRGTVVGDLQAGGLGGFHLQDAGDGDPATSDGVYVYAPGGTEVALGDVVTVTGTVAEFRRAADLDPGTATQLTSPTVTPCGTAALPEPAVLPLPSTTEQRESLEGMSVTLPADVTVTEVYALNTFGELLLSSGGRLLSPTEAAEPGAPAQAVAADDALRTITLDDAVSANLSTSGQAPPYLAAGDPVRVGDTVAEQQPSVLGYGFDAYRLQPADGSAAGTTFAATNPRPAAPAEVGGTLRIADYNVLNYFITFGGQSRGAATPAELAEQQAKIVAGITALDADVVTLHEIENSAVTTPETPYAAIETLLAAVEAVDGHEWAYVPAHEDTDVITNAIVYRTDVVTPVGGPQVPADLTAFDNARTPIAQTFAQGTEVLTVVANHLKSKGSGSGEGNTDTGDGQGASNADRVAQAEALVAFAAQLAESSGDPDVLLTGDFNSYRYEDPLDVVRDAGFTDLGPLLAPGQYSYVFDGGAGSLDHAFASPSLVGQVTGLTVWDTNATESSAYQYDGYQPLYAADPYRASDHNPTVLGLDLDTPATAAVDHARPFRGDRVTVTGSGFAPGERVTVTIGGRQVGSATADDAGTVTVRPRVPVLLAAGEQHVVLTGASGESAGTTVTLRTLWQELVDRLRGLLGG